MHAAVFWQGLHLCAHVITHPGVRSHMRYWTTHLSCTCMRPSTVTTFACKFIVYTFGVGRSPLADVIMDYPSISPLHAALHYDDVDAGYWYVTDVGSAPGTAFHAWPTSSECTEIKVQTPVTWLCWLP